MLASAPVAELGPRIQRVETRARLRGYNELVWEGLVSLGEIVEVISGVPMDPAAGDVPLIVAFLLLSAEIVKLKLIKN